MLCTAMVCHWWPFFLWMFCFNFECHFNRIALFRWKPGRHMYNACVHSNNFIFDGIPSNLIKKNCELGELLLICSLANSVFLGFSPKFNRIFNSKFLKIWIPPLVNIQEGSKTYYLFEKYLARGAPGTRNTPKMFVPPSARRNLSSPPPLTWNPGSAPVSSHTY